MSELTGVAKRVHDNILACRSDEEAALYARIVVGAALQRDMNDHREVIQRRIDTVVAKQMDAVRKSVVRTVVAKNAAGEDPSALLDAVDLVSKASGDDLFTRDARGRFSTVESRRRINYHTRAGMLPRDHARAMGIPTAKDLKALKQQDAAAYQQAYAQVSDLVSPYASMPAGESVLHLTFRRPNGSVENRTVDVPTKVENGRVIVDEMNLDPHAFADGGRLVEASVATNPNLSVRGAAFDLVGAIGGAGAGIAANRALTQTTNSSGNQTGRFAGAERLGSFADQWNRQDVAEIGSPRGGIFRRLSAGSQLLQSIIGEHAPERVKLALMAGDFVGQYGAQAEKVIGPHADRTAYRYRGIERKPDPGLQRTVDAIRAKHGPDREDAARRELIYGRITPTVVGGRSDPRTVADHQHSPLVRYFQGRLPDKDLIHLQRQSGVIPPSEGVIIDRKGKIVTQAVGYGEDWYLPFNLKTLSRVNGGEYVRTRAWGGPTTEDIYAGLVSGARAVTVISHNGVYTIEFDDAFRGSRRYSDKAARMVKRYGQLLDAVKSRQVTLAGVPESRMDELAAEAGRYYSPKEDREKYRAKLDELVADERQDPTMSAEDRNALAVGFLEERAIADNGDAQSWPELAAQMVERDVTRARALSSPTDGFDEAGARRIAAEKVDTPIKVITALGPSATAAWNRQLKAKTAEYRAAQSPLNLDGVGYQKSMEALREQFPYYIDSVHYQPLRLGGTDPGYVKPNFTRPEKALAGYFDETIEGAGKVSADQTRFQNGMDPAQARRRVLRERPDDGTPTVGGSGAGPSPQPGLVPQQVAAARDQASVTALWKALNAKKDGNMDTGPHAGQPAAQAYAALRREMPLIYAKTEAEFVHEYAQEPTRVKAQLLEQADKAKRVFTVDDALLDAVRDPQAQVRGRKWNYLEAVNAPGQTFDFGEFFAPGRSTDSYADRGERLLGLLPVQADFHDDGLDAKLDAFIRDRHSEFLKAGQPGPHVDVNKVEADVQRAVQVKQLKRRYNEALAAEDARVAAPATPPSAAPNIVVLNVKPGEAGGGNDVADLLRRASIGDLDFNDLTRPV